MKTKYLNIPSGKLIIIKWKAIETISDIEKGRLSFSKSLPLLVSYYPDEKKYLIMDGHHRAIELFNEGQRLFCCQIAEHQPKTYNIDYPIVTLKSFLNTYHLPIQVCDAKTGRYIGYIKGWSYN